MTTTEHLAKIRAKCVELQSRESLYGLAQAGWQSTIAAIDMWEELNRNCCGWKDDNGCAGAAIQHYHCATAAIISAWPEELL